MDTYDQHTVTRLRSLLQLTFSSRSSLSELSTWCQIAFPGCCYLSCATLTADHKYATTSNLAARGSFQVLLQPARRGRPVLGAVLHNSWSGLRPCTYCFYDLSERAPASRPLQYPDLQLLQESCPWDCVIVSGVPEVSTAAGSSATGSPQANGFGVSPQDGSIGSLADLHISPLEAHQAEVGDIAAKSMLILGLCGQDHDLERTLFNLQMLSHQLAPVMHDHRQQLIDQALHAANTAAAAAAAAAVSAFASPWASKTPNPPPSPFADVEEEPNPALPLGSFDGQDRRREISGSLPLDQILSRLPSPCYSADALDQQFTEGALSQFPSRRTSRLGASLDLSRLLHPASNHLMVGADTPDVTAAQLAQDSRRASLGDSAGWGFTRRGSDESKGPADSFGECMTSLLASGLGFLDSLREDRVSDASQHLITDPTAVSRPSSGLLESSHGGMPEAHLEAEVEERFRAQRQHRQHPWLLYFYDQQTEREYSRYHAQQMAMVDAFSWGLGTLTYLRVGLANGHAYASREPVTFVMVLAFLFACLYAAAFQPQRLSQVRELLLRGATLIYLAVQSFVLMPSVLQSASIAEVQGVPFLARYSNVATLVASSLAYMVRLHIHLPCQLVSCLVSAAILPQALCKAGCPQYSSWKCTAVGASTQFLIGFVLTTVIVALNERRLRRMYIESAAAQRAAATKAKMT